MVKLLTEAQAHVNTQTEVHLVVCSLSIFILSFLVCNYCTNHCTFKALVIVSIHVQDGMTALYLASLKGHRAVIKQLLQCHADVSITKKVYIHEYSIT